MRKLGGLHCLVAGLAWLLAIGPSALADDKYKRRAGDGDVHQDQVLEAMRKGEIRPFSEVLAAGEKAQPGQVLGVKVKRKEGRLVYELKVLTSDGRLREVYVDAANLQIVRVE